jgi:hypothetical protein
MELLMGISMSKKKIFIYASLLFLSGLAFGVVCDQAMLHFRRFRHFEGGHRNMPAVIMEHLEDELSLSDDQEKKLAPIVEEMHQKARAVGKENQPRMEAILDEATEKALPILSEPQQVKLRELEERVKRHFERRFQ